MNAPQDDFALKPGQPYAGGFIAGSFILNGKAFALIVAPKEQGEHHDIEWIGDYQDVPNAKSYNDGYTNTLAMAEAGSELAKWATSLNIADFTDWYIPSQDELEIIYRNLKPTDDKNSCWMRSGINLSAPIPTRPYTRENPLQTEDESFKKGGSEAFQDTLYWSSTQYEQISVYAWYQNFYNGNQDYYNKSYEFRARAVRRVAI